MTLGEMASSPLFWVLTVAINLVSVACAWLIKRAAVGFWQSHTERGRKRKDRLEKRVRELVQSQSLRSSTVLDLSSLRWLSVLIFLMGVTLLAVLAALSLLAGLGAQVPLWTLIGAGVFAVLCFVLFLMISNRAIDLTSSLRRAYAQLREESTS